MRRGDTVAVVAPSSPFDEGLLRRGMAWLEERYRVVVRDDVVARQGFLAGSDDRRLDELTAAMTDPDVKAIVAARGGHGATRILSRLPWDAFARAPKWLVGFSDITALHAMAWARGVASLHGPHGAFLGKDRGGAQSDGPTSEEKTRLVELLEGRASATLWEGLASLTEGEAQGNLVGGNLSLLAALAAAQRLRLPANAVLALEDVTERPYRIDRMLTSLLEGGHLDSVVGVVLGDFTACDPGPDGVTSAEVLAERLGTLGIPVVAGAPFGHGVRNEPFVLGGWVKIVATDGQSGRPGIGRGTGKLVGVAEAGTLGDP